MVFRLDGFHLTMRTHGVNQAFRFVEGIWLHRRVVKSDFFTEKTFYSIRSQHVLSYHLIYVPWFELGPTRRVFTTVAHAVCPFF